MAKKPEARPEIRPISKADAAAQKSVTRGAVSLACREGGPLHAALLEGGRLNAAHPAYVAWLKGGRKAKAGPARAPTTPKKSKGTRAAAPTDPAKSTGNRGRKPTAEPPPAYPARMPKDDELSGLLATFGTHRNLSDSLKLRKTYVDLCEKELRLKEAKGQVIKREILATIIAGFERAFHQLLTDLPKTASRELYAMARSDRPLEDAELKTKELVSSHLTAAKEQVRRTLKVEHGQAAP